MSETRTYPVTDDLIGERADVGVANLLGISRTQAVDLIESFSVFVDGDPISKSDRLKKGWLVDVISRPASEAEPSLIAAPFDVELPVIYSDDEVVVINKPFGVAAHASVGWTGPNVLDLLTSQGHRISTSGDVERQGIVQRLDVGTSGLMVITKNEDSFTDLKQQFRDRSVMKVYQTVVQGYPDPGSGTIDAPIGRHPGADYRFAVIAGGKPSVTHYDTLEMFRSASLLRIELETGRTHQIRVHMSAVRHPCVGDLTYGADPKMAAALGLTRQWLHAIELEFKHPKTGEQVRFTAELPSDLTLALERLADYGN